MQANESSKLTPQEEEEIAKANYLRRTARELMSREEFQESLEMATPKE